MKNQFPVVAAITGWYAKLEGLEKVEGMEALKVSPAIHKGVWNMYTCYAYRTLLCITYIGLIPLKELAIKLINSTAVPS